MNFVKLGLQESLGPCLSKARKRVIGKILFSHNLFIRLKKYDIFA